MRQPSAQPPLGSVQLIHSRLQKKHSPQKVSTFTATQPPGCTVVTTPPASSTIPTILWPTVILGTAWGDATVLDMEITGANTRQSYPDDGVPFVLQNGQTSGQSIPIPPVRAVSSALLVGTANHSTIFTPKN